MYLPVAAKVSLTFIGFAIAAGNGTVFLVFFSNRSLRTLTNRFVLSLAVSDFFVGTVLLPLRVWSPTSEALGPLIAFMLTASLSNISGCTYDRYIAIHNPLRYHAILTSSKVRRIIFLIWAVPVTIALIPQIWLRQAHRYDQHTILLAQRIYVGLMSFGVLVTCIVLAAIYISVFRVAKRHVDAISCLEGFAQQQRGATRNGVKRRNSLKSLVKDVKATKLAAMIGFAFALCWFPLILINIIDSLGFNHVIPDDFATVALFTIFVNSFMNPMIYAFFQKDFRRNLSKLLRKQFTRRDTSHLPSSTYREEESHLVTSKLKTSFALNERQNNLVCDHDNITPVKRPSAVSFNVAPKETSHL